jgi:hypothetical protein
VHWADSWNKAMVLEVILIKELPYYLHVMEVYIERRDLI